MLCGLGFAVLRAGNRRGMPVIGTCGGSRIITYILRNVERDILNRLLRDFVREFLFGPPEPQRGADIPRAFLQGQVSVHENQILRPAKSHCLPHDARSVFILAVKVPHPAHIARGEPGHVRIRALQMLRDSHSSSFLRSVTDQPPDFPVQLHLRQRGAHSAVHGREQLAVVNGFSDVHGFLLPGTVRLFVDTDKRGHLTALAQIKIPLQWSISC